jgi:hypothetical protein
MIRRYTRNNARAANPNIFKITYGLLGKKEMSSKSLCFEGDNV